MVAKKPKVVIIGAGMAGLTAAHKLYTTPGSRDLFELSVVEGGTRIGGRINTSEFGGDRIEMGATWIHGIIGSPVYKIAEEINSLESQKPWECMNGFTDEKIKVADTIAEGGLVVNPSIVEPISSLFDKLLEIAQCKLVVEDDGTIQNNGGGVSVSGGEQLSSVGSFLRQGLQAYWESKKGIQKEAEEEMGRTLSDGGGDWNVKLLEEAIFAMCENTQRTYTGAGDLYDLDYAAESEYRMFPGEEITIPRGYTSVIEALASALPAGLIQLGKKVVRIQWLPNDVGGRQWLENYDDDRVPRSVKLHFTDGSIVLADHVIVTVSLGVLKAGIQQESSGLFSPPLPDFKTEAISRLGYGVVNKLFLKLGTAESNTDCHRDGSNNHNHPKFPYMQMVFHRLKSAHRHQKIPWWMRRTSSLYPIYSNSSVLLCWFAGKEALELEDLDDKEIIDGVSRTVSSFLCSSRRKHKNSKFDDHELHCNSNLNFDGSCYNNIDTNKFTKVLKSKWGTDPLFLGSYSYVAAGSSGDDLDKMAEPLPRLSDVKNLVVDDDEDRSAKSKIPCSTLQILFAGEATHRTHYSTTHGAYLSGLREANRLLQHYSSYVGAGAAKSD